MNNPIVVSIVIPHYNNNQRLAKTLCAVKKEIRCGYSVEVLVVDNGSDVSPKKNVEHFKFRYLVESGFLNSPYSARNRGIEKASGDILILLDSTCVPQKDWLKNGLEFMSNNDADIVSANIVYECFSSKPTLSEIWDSAFGVNVKKAIEKRNYAPGGCLFIKREVINSLGLFEEGQRSGGDYTFTNTAVRRGYKLMFCENSVVKYPAKKLPELKKKAIRVGKGQVGIWLNSGRFWLYFLKFLAKPFYPPNPKAVRMKFRSACKSHRSNNYLFVRLLFFDWYLRWLQCYGNVLGLTYLVRAKSRVSKTQCGSFF